MSATGRRNARSNVTIVLLYTLGAIWLTSRFWGHPTSRLPGGSDGELFAWFLGWTPHALAHGQNLLLTHAALAPGPVNLMWNTLAPVLGLIAAPITLIWGPIASVNVMVAAAFVANATAAWWVLRRWCETLPAVFGGALYGFGPYVLGASLGHLNLAFVPLPWIMLALGDDLIVRRRPPLRCGVLLGLVVATQALISEEVLATCAIVAGCAVVVLMLLRRHDVRSRIRSTFIGLGVAILTAAVILAWPLYIQFAGPGRVNGTFPNLFGAVADLYGTVVPGPLLIATNHHLVALFHHFPTNGSESTSYLGIPLIAALIYVGWTKRRDPVIATASITATLAAILALGSHLHVGGHDTHVILPWRVIFQLPVLANAIPVRLSLFVMLFAALVLARGFTRPASTGGRWAASILGLAIVVSLLPARVSATEFSTPAFFLSSHDRRLLAGLRPALVLPLAYSGDARAMAWQANADFAFSMVGGYLVTPNDRGQPSYGTTANAFERALVDVDLGKRSVWTKRDLADWRSEFATMDLSNVVLGPTRWQARLDSLVDAVLNCDGRMVDGVTVWATSDCRRSR